MDKEAHRSAPVVGGSSLLVIFAVLCLTVFALLALSTAQANARLSQATAQAISDYYQADCQAEELFARLRAGELPEGVTSENNIYSYSCPISDTRQLQVELHRENDVWTVLRWQAVSTVNWETDDTLPVWSGT